MSKAWRIKEIFRDISFKQIENRACKLFLKWRNHAMVSKIPRFIKVVEMFDRHLKDIVNAIECGSTNAKAERINGAIQKLKKLEEDTPIHHS